MLIDASRCQSLQRINLSNLKLLSKLILAGCSGLTEILGLGELTSLEKINLEDCRSLLTHNFPKTLFQIYTGFEQEVLISLNKESFPDWITQSSVEGSADDYSREEISDGSDESNFDVSIISYVNLQPNLSHNYLGMILCFETRGFFEDVYYSVMTSASNILRSGCYLEGVPDHRHMVTVPRSIFRVTETDHTIKFTSNARTHWIRLLYKDENDLEVEGGSDRISNFYFQRPNLKF